MPGSIFFPIDSTDIEGHINIDKMEALVNQGRLYGFHFENLALASGSTVIIHVKTGAKQVHYFHTIEAYGARVRMQVCEGATISTAGTVITANNRNRVLAGSSPALTTAIYSGSTYATVGTVIATRQILAGAAATPQKAAASNELASLAKRVFKANTDYLTILTSYQDNAIVCFDKIFWEV